MKLEHIAIWTQDLERLKDFYVRYFNGVAGERFENPAYSFASYFVRFEGGSRLELMQMPSVPRSRDDVRAQFTGYIHIAFDVGTRQELESLAARLPAEGLELLEAPHVTADGYYEATVLDPDGNRVELAVMPEAMA